MSSREDCPGEQLIWCVRVMSPRRDFSDNFLLSRGVNTPPPTIIYVKLNSEKCELYEKKSTFDFCLLRGYRGGQGLGYISPKKSSFLRPPFREDTHKKRCFFGGRTTKVLPSLHLWPSGPLHFFFFFLVL